jgi:hypothetical protein
MAYEGGSTDGVGGLVGRSEAGSEVARNERGCSELFGPADTSTKTIDSNQSKRRNRLFQIRLIS